jgi:phosphoglycolate phosphatase
MSQKQSIVLFDLDGTLIDSTEAIVESFGVAFSSFQQPIPSSESIKAQIGHPLDAMFCTLGVSKDIVWDYVHAYKMHYRTISRQKTVLLPRAKETIALASQYATLGVVTTKTAKYSRELLEHFGVMHYFNVLIGREDVENPKPHPEPIHKALKQLPKVSDIWMVGDTCMDIEAAKQAKVKSVAVLCGYGTQESLKVCGTTIVNNAYEAVEFIDSVR